MIIVWLTYIEGEDSSLSTTYPRDYANTGVKW
jgi:hypothetical protein